MKKELGISEKIVKYIENNHISVAQVVHDTGIPEEKLSSGEQPLTATEFLEICSYLNLRPEEVKNLPGRNHEY